MTVKLSVITPVYNEEESLPHLIPAIEQALKDTKLTWELIAIDDGSTDKSVEALHKLAKKHKELKVVELRRNYGQTAAMQAGFDHAEGEIWVTLDADLQNDPADIPNLLKVMEEENVDIVVGWRHKRKDNALIRNFPSKIANKLIGRVTGVKIHDYGCSLKAYRAEIIKEVKIYGELHRFIPAVASQYGAKVAEVKVNHNARQWGSSKYGIDRTFRVILDLLAVKFFLKYLHRPMHAFGMVGLWCLIPGSLGLTYLTALKLFGNDIGGRPLLILSVMLILIGVQLVGMGILGELLTRVYHEPAGRKQYLLKKSSGSARVD